MLTGFRGAGIHWWSCVRIHGRKLSDPRRQSSFQPVNRFFEMVDEFLGLKVPPSVQAASDTRKSHHTAILNLSQSTDSLALRATSMTGSPSSDTGSLFAPPLSFSGSTGRTIMRPIWGSKTVSSA